MPRGSGRVTQLCIGKVFCDTLLGFWRNGVEFLKDFFELHFHTFGIFRLVVREAPEVQGTVNEEIGHHLFVGIVKVFGVLDHTIRANYHIAE